MQDRLSPVSSPRTSGASNTIVELATTTAAECEPDWQHLNESMTHFIDTQVAISAEKLTEADVEVIRRAFLAGARNGIELDDDDDDDDDDDGGGSGSEAPAGAPTPSSSGGGGAPSSSFFAFSSSSSSAPSADGASGGGGGVPGVSLGLLLHAAQTVASFPAPSPMAPMGVIPPTPTAAHHAHHGAALFNVGFGSGAPMVGSGAVGGGQTQTGAAALMAAGAMLGQQQHQQHHHPQAGGVSVMAPGGFALPGPLQPTSLLPRDLHHLSLFSPMGPRMLFGRQQQQQYSNMHGPASSSAPRLFHKRSFHQTSFGNGGFLAGGGGGGGAAGGSGGSGGGAVAGPMDSAAVFKRVKSAMAVR